MATFDFKAALGLERSISCLQKTSLTDSQKLICEQVKDFGIDEIYFSTDEGKSYPAVFLKKVAQFDSATLKAIAKTHKKIWNYQKVLFLYVYTDTEIRIYNCTAKPFVENKDTDYKRELELLEIKHARYQDKKALSQLVAVFSSVAIDTGIIWTLPDAIEIRKKINLQKRVDKYLVDSLTKTTKRLQELGLSEIPIIHKLILRSLFLLYLEDRGATDTDFYNGIKKGAKSYFDILDDVTATYTLFEKLESQFNGNVFSLIDGEKDKIKEEYLQLIKKCFINGYEENGQLNIFPNWRLFDFKIIQIELLSEIYERFLSETDKKKKKKAGAYYTPPALVALVLDEVLPVGKNYTNYNVKILDPACGSGIFLVESYRRLLVRYENANGRKPSDFDELKQILTNNIYGIEKNNQAIIVAAFSLYLALVDNLDPKTLWMATKLPCLVNDPINISKGKQGDNLFCRDTISENKEIESIQFDLVIGNPPFGTENKKQGITLLPSIRNYCDKYGFAKEMVLPFLHKAIKFAPEGKIALIFNTKILTNTIGTYEKFRKWFFNECYVEKIYNFSILRKSPNDFGGQLFGSATGPVCIAFYQKENPLDVSERVIYYAPKTYIKTNLIDGVVIDSSDVKYLPRDECKNPKTKIWKLAMWGGNKDLEFLKTLQKEHIELTKYLEENHLISGVGLETSSPAKIVNDKIKAYPLITPTNIDIYSTDRPSTLVETCKFRRLGGIDIYDRPHIVLAERALGKIDDDTQIIASFVNYSSAYVKGIVGIASLSNNTNILKLITLFLNSSFVRYYAFLTTSSWGIERPDVKHKELFHIPFLFDNIDSEGQLFLLNCYNEILNAKKAWQDITPIRKKIDEYIYQIIGSENATLIKDAALQIDLFQKQENSIAQSPISDGNNYLATICSSLNDFIGDEGIITNGTIFNISRDCPLYMVKISFDHQKCGIEQSSSNIQEELREISTKLWDEKGGSVYFRKKLNYYDGESIYLIRPNQQRFWTRSMAMEDAAEIIMDILKMED